VVTLWKLGKQRNWSERIKTSIVVSTRGGATTTPVEVEVVVTSNSKAPIFIGKHGD
jgi:hypothetical protein